MIGLGIYFNYFNMENKFRQDKNLQCFVRGVKVYYHFIDLVFGKVMYSRIGRIFIQIFQHIQPFLKVVTMRLVGET